MKKTFLAMILAGSSMALFAQTTPTTNPTTPTNPTTSPASPTTNPTSPTTKPTTSPANLPSTTAPTTTSPTGTMPSTNAPTSNGNVTNSTTDPMKTTTSPATNNGSLNNGTTNGSLNNGSLNNGSMNNGSMNNGTMNNLNNGTPTNLGWSNYGIWDNTTGANGTNMNNGTGNTINNGTTDYNSSRNNSSMNNGSMNNNSVNNSTMNNGSMNSNGNMNHSMSTNGAANSSAGNYNAYGTPNVTVPYSVQMNYGNSYPSSAGTINSWSQYGDWFFTTNMNNGRYSQIYYDQKGNGYSLALPVLNTYVPDNVVTAALQKYGSSLYSITALKGADGKEAYQVNLLDRGQPKMEWVGNDGASAMNIYRTDEMNGTMNESSTNAAMDNSSSNSTNLTTADEGHMNNSADQDTTVRSNGLGKKMKSITRNADGTVTKTVIKPGGKVKMKTKNKGGMRKDSTEIKNGQQ